MLTVMCQDERLVMRGLALIGVLAVCNQLGAAVVNVSDYTSLRTAIMNANASVSGGDTIVLANGTYTITSPIDIEFCEMNPLKLVVSRLFFD